MLTHKIELQLLGGNEGVIRPRLFLYQTQASITGYPLTEIMIPTTIAVQLTIIIPDGLQPLQIILPSSSAMHGCKRQGCSCFYKCGTIQLPKIYNQFLLFVHL